MLPVFCVWGSQQVADLKHHCQLMMLNYTYSRVLVLVTSQGMILYYFIAADISNHTSYYKGANSFLKREKLEADFAVVI